MSGYFDYRYKFPDVADIVGALDALRASGLIGDGLPNNMLGDPRDDAGEWTSEDPQTATWRGCKARPAITYTDPDTNQPETVGPTGDGHSWYVHIRSEIPPDHADFDPSAHNMTEADPAESAQVLGVWA